MSANPVRRTAPILIYLLPALADMLVAQFMFINTVRLARVGASASVVANTLTVWSVVYLLACPVIGRFVTAANAARMMVGSMAGTAVLAVLFTVMNGIAWVYILMALAGLAMAFFFPPFLVFMKAVDRLDNKPMTYSTGLYTFSWSMGFAVGPFVSGFLMEFGPSGWKVACLFAVVVAVVTAIGVLLLKNLIQGAPGINVQQAMTSAERPIQLRGNAGRWLLDVAIPSGPAADYSRQPNLVWMGWVGGGVGVILITLVRAVFPARAESSLHLAQSTQGIIFFLVSLSQAVTGLALCRSRYWMYRPKAVAAFGVLGLLGTVAFGFGQSTLALVAGAVLFGVYAGSFFFYLVFHALVHPQRSSQYVAVNESVVGICGMLGAIIGGWVADQFGFGAVYAAGVALLFVTLVVQWRVHRSYSAR